MAISGNFKVQVREKATLCDRRPLQRLRRVRHGLPDRGAQRLRAEHRPAQGNLCAHGQAVPLIYTMDMDNCIHCYKCVDACGKLDAIDFSQEAQRSWQDIGLDHRRHRL